MSEVSQMAAHRVKGTLMVLCIGLVVVLSGAAHVEEADDECYPWNVTLHQAYYGFSLDGHPTYAVTLTNHCKCKLMGTVLDCGDDEFKPYAIKPAGVLERVKVKGGGSTCKLKVAIEEGGRARFFYEADEVWPGLEVEAYQGCV